MTEQQLVSKDKRQAQKQKDLRKCLNKIELEDWFSKNMRDVDNQKNMEYLRMIGGKVAKIA